MDMDFCFATGKNVKPKRVTKSERSARAAELAGIIFPIDPVKKWLKEETRMKIMSSASIYLAAVLTYLCGEVFDFAGESAKTRKRSKQSKRRIKSRDIFLGVSNDSELDKVLQHVTIRGSGALPHICPQLLQSRSQRNSESGSLADDQKSKKVESLSKNRSPKKIETKAIAKKGRRQSKSKM